MTPILIMFIVFIVLAVIERSTPVTFSQEEGGTTQQHTTTLDLPELDLSTSNLGECHNSTTGDQTKNLEGLSQEYMLRLDSSRYISGGVVRYKYYCKLCHRTCADQYYHRLFHAVGVGFQCKVCPGGHWFSKPHIFQEHLKLFHKASGEGGHRAQLSPVTPAPVAVQQVNPVQSPEEFIVKIRPDQHATDKKRQKTVTAEYFCKLCHVTVPDPDIHRNLQHVPGSGFQCKKCPQVTWFSSQFKLNRHVNLSHSRFLGESVSASSSTTLSEGDAVLLDDNNGKASIMFI